MQEGMRLRPGLLWLIVATLLWGGNYIAGRVLAFQISPMTLNAARWAISSVILAVVMRLSGRRLPWREWKVVAVMGFLGMFAFSFLTYVSLGHVAASQAGLISGTMPVMIMILSVLVLKERVSLVAWVGVGFSIVGVFLVVSRQSFGVMRLSMGDGELLLAAIAWALYTVLGKKFGSRVDALTMTFGAAIVGAGLSTGAAMIYWRNESIHLSSMGFVALLYVSTLASVAAYLLWTQGVKAVGPTRAGPLMNLLPIWTVLLGLMLLHERLSLHDFLGGALIIGGAVLAGRPQRPLAAAFDLPGGE